MNPDKQQDNVKPKTTVIPDDDSQAIASLAVEDRAAATKDDDAIQRPFLSKEFMSGVIHSKLGLQQASDDPSYRSQVSRLSLLQVRRRDKSGSVIDEPLCSIAVDAFLDAEALPSNGFAYSETIHFKNGSKITFVLKRGSNLTDPGFLCPKHESMVFCMTYLKDYAEKAGKETVDSLLGESSPNKQSKICRTLADMMTKEDGYSTVSGAVWRVLYGKGETNLENMNKQLAFKIVHLNESIEKLSIGEQSTNKKLKDLEESHAKLLEKNKELQQSHNYLTLYCRRLKDKIVELDDNNVDDVFDDVQLDADTFGIDYNRLQAKISALQQIIPADFMDTIPDSLYHAHRHMKSKLQELYSWLHPNEYHQVTVTPEEHEAFHGAFRSGRDAN